MGDGALASVLHRNGKYSRSPLVRELAIVPGPLERSSTLFDVHEWRLHVGSQISHQDCATSMIVGGHDICQASAVSRNSASSTKCSASLLSLVQGDLVDLTIVDIAGLRVPTEKDRGVVNPRQ